jgi:hypothetical protein
VEASFARELRHHVIDVRISVRRLVRRGWLVMALMPLAAGCLADPQKNQSVDLLIQLTSAREQFAQRPQEACDMVGNVQTKLYGEPGLTNLQPAWANLRDAAAALQAVCGQSTLLGQPFNDSTATLQARERWHEGIQRESGVACDHLRIAAAGLGRSSPC